MIRSLRLSAQTLAFVALIFAPAHAQIPRFAYIANELSNSVGVYTIDPNTGALAHVSLTATGTLPTTVSIDTKGRFAYVVNANAEAGSSSTISVFAIDANTGALTEIPGSPFPGGGDAEGASFHPSGKFVYVTSDLLSSNVSAFSVDLNTGALTPIPGSPYATGTTSATATVDPTGKFVFVSSGVAPNGTPAVIFAFSINPSSGALTPVPGSPFAAGIDPGPIAFGAGGKFLYTGNGNNAATGNTINAFTVNSTSGALTPIPGSPFPTGSNPRGVTSDPTGQFLYVANRDSNNVSGYSIDANTGFLTPMAGSPFAADSGPFWVAVEPTGHFVYVTNFANDVSVYTISPTTGALTQVAGSPFPTGSEPVWVDFSRALPCTTGQKIVPNNGGNTGSLSASLFCMGAQPGAQVGLRGVGADIIGTSPNVSNSGALMTATFNLTGAAPGARNVIVTNSNGTSTTLPNSFTVAQGGAPQLWANTVGFNAIRIGFKQVFFVTYGNRGNVDALGGHVVISFPNTLALSLGFENEVGVVSTVSLGTNTIITVNVGRVPAGANVALPVLLTAGPTQKSFNIQASISSR